MPATHGTFWVLGVSVILGAAAACVKTNVATWPQPTTVTVALRGALSKFGEGLSVSNVLPTPPLFGVTTNQLALSDTDHVGQFVLTVTDTFSPDDDVLTAVEDKVRYGVALF